MTSSTISSTSSLSQRFRRAIVNNDLASAKRIAEKAFAKNGAETDPFTIQNQTVSRNDSGTVLASLRLGVGEYDSTWFQTASTIESAALSASQYQSALQCRRREKNREAGRAKSSLAIAVENGANIDLVQWLLDMGHERGVFSTDARGCTIVSLAAQNNRCDIIEACCVNAVAHAATVHHQQSLQYGFNKSMLDEENETGNDEENDSDSLNSPALTLVTAEASTPSRRPSPALQQGLFAAFKERNSPDSALDRGGDDKKVTTEENGEFGDLVGTTLQRLIDAPDELGRTALSLACMNGHEEVVRLLIDIGADFNLADYEGNTPLHYASAYNHLVIVQLLLERGCAHATKNDLEFTAADYAYTNSLKSALEAIVRSHHDNKRAARSRITASAAAAAAEAAAAAPSPAVHPYDRSPVRETSSKEHSVGKNRSNSLFSATSTSSSSRRSTNSGQIRSPEITVRSSPKVKSASLRSD